MMREMRKNVKITNNLMFKALIVQGIEQRFPKPPIQVRVLVRAQSGRTRLSNLEGWGVFCVLILIARNLYLFENCQLIIEN